METLIDKYIAAYIKHAALKKKLDTLKAENAELRKRVTTLKKQPIPLAKGLV